MTSHELYVIMVVKMNNKKYKTPKGLTLYPFQREDADRMKSMPHVLLFSEMGTGKTPLSIVHVMEKNLLPALVICPRSLKLNWWDEIEKWTGLKSYYTETCDEVVEVYFDPETERQNFFIIHHEALAYTADDPVREMITKISWKSIIIDESHRFRNLHTERTRTLLEFNNHITKFMFLTGTPIVNSPFDMFPMLQLVGIEDRAGEFLNHYTKGRDKGYGYVPTGSKNIEELLEELAPIYIRRTKAEVLKELPEKKIQTIKLKMPEDQRKVYDNFEEMLCLALDDGEEIHSANILAMLTRLRQLNLDPNILGRNTGSSKTQAVLDLLEANQLEKWVIASTSKKFIRLLEKKIKGIVTITGDESLPERRNAEIRFKSNPMIKVLGTTMQTGGLGLNLQAANNIIVTDPWWNSATIHQQVDRLHRIGQTKIVLVYMLENEKSVDQLMNEVVARKDEDIGKIVVEQDVIRSIYERRRGYEYETPTRA